MPTIRLAFVRTVRDLVWRQLLPILMALTLVAGTTAVLSGLRTIIEVRQVSIVYLIPVLITASQWGVVPAVISAITSVAFTAFFFYPPVGFTVSDPQQVIDLSLFVFVAVITSQMATNAKLQAEIARRREDETRGLYALSRRLAAARDAGEIHAAVREHLGAIIPRRIALIGADSGNDTAERATLPEPVAREAERMVAQNDIVDAGTLIDDGTGDLWMVRPVSDKTKAFGVAAIDLGVASHESAVEARRQIDAILLEASASLERLDLARAINEAKMRSETDLLREALIGSVSHELRTPLASILGAATVLCQAGPVVEDSRLESLTQVIRGEAERLNDEVQNLIDSTRISSEGVRPRPGWVEPADIINAAIARRKYRLADHRLVLDVDNDLPLIYVDSSMLGQAVGQLLDNAAKYSPAGTPIVVQVKGGNGTMAISVIDRGHGLVGEETTRLWERFFRGERIAGRVSGSGLGLWIAHAFVTANGGLISASSEGPELGTNVTITLPVPENPPDEPAIPDE